MRKPRLRSPSLRFGRAAARQARRKRGKTSRPRFSFEFPYSRIQGQHYPLVPISLHLNGRSVSTFGLLDSGASISLFRPEIARALGIPRSGPHGHVLKLAKGRLNAIICHVDVDVEGVRFPALIGFSRGHTAAFNIVGRKGFFEEFGVYIDEARRKIGLVRRS